MSENFDHRIRVEAWNADSALPPDVEYFAANDARIAINRARYLSEVRTNLRTVIVVDAWSMRLAEFMPTYLYRPPGDGADGRMAGET